MNLQRCVPFFKLTANWFSQRCSYFDKQQYRHHGIFLPARAIRCRILRSHTELIFVSSRIPTRSQTRTLRSRTRSQTRTRTQNLKVSMKSYS